jgi:hypothetical protein
MEINYEQEDEYRMCRHFPAGVCLERSCRKQRYNTIQRPRDAIMTTISSLGRPPALSKRNPSFSTKAIASVAQSEASSITAHGEQALQFCRFVLIHFQPSLHLGEIERRFAFHHLEVDGACGCYGLHDVPATLDGIEVLSVDNCRPDAEGGNKGCQAKQ